MLSDDVAEIRETARGAAPSLYAGRSAPQIVFSFPLVLGALLVLLTLLTIRGRFSDPDLWWHLKTGEIIWNTHHIPTVDTFSYTTNQHPYVPHEWLSQLSIYAAYRIAGYTGLMLWFAILASLLVAGGYALCAMYSGNLKVAFLGGLIVWLFATVGLAVRPQMVGYLFLVAALAVLYLGASRNRAWFYTLPPIFAVWVNCHGSFSLGLILVGATLACSFLELEWGLLVSHRWDKPRRKALAIAFALSIAALFLNPIGFGQLTYALGVMTNLKINTTQVSEWQPPRFDDMRGLGLLAVAGLILLVPLLRRTKLTVLELLLAALGFGLAVQHARMMFVFGILSAPILCRLLADAWENYEPDQDKPVVNAILIAILLSVAFWTFPNRRQLVEQTVQYNPVKAVDFIHRSGLSGNMLNEYVFGGYLIWAAPDHKVFVDGRGDVFEWSGVLEEYGNWMTLQADPKALLEKYKIGFCLLTTGAPMNRVLALMPGWTKAYSDDLSVIWTRSAAAPAPPPIQ